MSNNEIQVFNNAKFGQVRSLVIEGEPWFVGKDVAEALGYSNTADAIQKHIDDEDKLTSRIAIAGQNRNVICINESGIYSLIFGSKVPAAKEFKHWVTAEVLPTIRNTGSYSMYSQTPTDHNEALTADVLYILASKWKADSDAKKQLEARIKILEDKLDTQNLQPVFKTPNVPKDSKKIYTVTDIAKEIGMSPKALNNFLRDHDIQVREGGHYELAEGMDAKQLVYYRTYMGYISQMLWTEAGRLYVLSYVDMYY